MPRIALFPGSFDPFTKGHEDIVLRSLNLFDEVIISIGTNAAKSRYFPLETMVIKIEDLFKDHPKVKVMTYQGLTAEFAKKIDAQYLIRGLRNTTDFEYENTISQANKYLSGNLETIFLITSPHLAYISSSIVRELHKYGGE